MQNRRLLMLLMLALFFAPAASAGDETNPVLREFETLKTNESAIFKKKDGWTIVSLQDDYTVWFFALENHSAAPAYIKRMPVERHGVVFIDSKVICAAAKADCDKLVQSFIILDRQIANEQGQSKD